MRSFERIDVSESLRNVDERQPADEIRREEWASQLLQSIAREVPTLGMLSSEGNEASPSGEPGDAGLTPPCDKLDASGAAAAQETSEAEPERLLSRLEFDVDAGSLGKVALGIERTGTSIHVVIGIEDPRQSALVDLERATLLASLKAAGLNVASVVVTSRAAAGTTLADARRGTNAHQQALASTAYRGRIARKKTDEEEGLDLVG